MPIRKICPKCSETSDIINSGWVTINKGKTTEQKRKRYKCKKCSWHFSVGKMGKEIEKYYQVKAIQLYLEGLSIEWISKMLAVSHDVIQKWLKPIKTNLDSIRLSIKDVEKEMSQQGRIMSINSKNVFTSGIIVQGEKSQVWGISRGLENKKETNYLKDNLKIEDEVYSTPTSSSTYDDIQIEPNLSDDDIMKEFG